MTEQTAHAEHFRTAGRNLHKLAEAMLSQGPAVGFDAMDVLGIFASVTTKLAIDTLGPAAAADYMQRVALAIVTAAHNGTAN